MSLRDALNRELNNYKREKAKLEKKLSQLPRGSLQKKEINRRIYFYEAYRVKSRVKYDYLGKDLSLQDIKRYETAKVLREKFRAELSGIRKEIRDIEDLLRKITDR